MVSGSSWSWIAWLSFSFSYLQNRYDVIIALVWLLHKSSQRYPETIVDIPSLINRKYHRNEYHNKQKETKERDMDDSK